MKVGELYDIARIHVPAITKRMFTKFYNLAIEKISRDARIYVVTEDFTATFGVVPYDAVKIEEITSEDETYTWSIVPDSNGNRLLKIYDSAGTEQTTVSDMTIRYWKIARNVIEPAENFILDPKDVITITVGVNSITVNKSFTGKYLVLAEDMTNDTGTTIVIPSGSVVINGLTGSGDFWKVSTVGLYPLASYVYLDFDEGNYGAYLIESYWEEQDDKFEEEIQLAALWYALSNVIDLVSSDTQQTQYFRGKFADAMHEVRVKYNVPKTYTSITPVYH